MGHAEEEEAIGWLIRLRAPAAGDWERFTAWLEQDPAHAEAYERIAEADADLAALAARARLRAPASTPRHRHRRLIGSGIAAALVAAIGGATLLGPSDADYAVTTAPGEHRAMVLADGTRIELNGDTRLLLDRREPRHVELTRGEASFAVRHDADHPFEVRAGDGRVRDEGTRFEVKRRGAVTEVAVAEGSIVYNPHREAIRLVAGERLRDPDGPAAIQRARVAAGAVAGWRAVPAAAAGG